MPKVFPRHGKSFAKLVRLSPLGRKQVGITSTVSRYVAGFKERKLEGLDLARAIVEDIASFEEKKLPQQKARDLWARRSGEEIITSRYAVVGKGTNLIMGCTDRTQAAVSALRAAGFPMLFVRQHLHTYAKMLVREGERWQVFIVDPSDEKRNRVRPMSGEDKKGENRAKGQNYFAEGLSPAHIGVFSYRNFFKYRMPKATTRD
jgi:hypothetical protein